MRSLIYHVAATLDGFICHADHSLDGFLAEGDHADEYLAALRTDYEAVVMGRKTYDLGLRMGVTNPYPWLRQYVVSRTLAQSPDPAVQLIADDPLAAVRALKNEDGKPIYLAGGGQLAATLLEAGLVDELIVKLNPVVFGAGIGMLPGIGARRDLRLRSSKTHANGVVVLRYTLD